MYEMQLFSFVANLSRDCYKAESFTGITTVLAPRGPLRRLLRPDFTFRTLLSPCHTEKDQESMEGAFWGPPCCRSVAVCE